MILEERLNLLERNHDWLGLSEALEQGLAGSTDPAQQAGLHLRLGRLLNGRFLQGVKALKHFQDAFKLNTALVEALAEARAIYWQLGKLNMVQKLLELQIKNTNGAAAGPLLVQLGDVLSDAGEADRATEAYAKALQTGGAPNAADLLHDVQVGDSDWQERVALLLRAGREAGTAEERANALLRAARITRRFAPDEIEGMLAQAYTASPTDVVAASLFEDLLARAGRTEEILSLQRKILSTIKDPAELGRTAFVFGTRWALRHQNHELGAEFISQALEADVRNEAAFAYLREIYGTMGGDWAKVVSLGDRIATSVGDSPASAFYLSSAGGAAWRQMGDLIRARTFFEKLAAVAPEHTALAAFELQIGQKLAASKPDGAGKAESPAPPPVAASPAPPPVAEEPAAAAAEEAPAPAAAPAPAVPAKAAPAASQGGGDAGKIAELRQLLAQQEAANRHHEFVKTLVALGDEVTDPAERVGFYEKAAELYVSKFMNQAEAVKVFEKIIDIEPGHSAAVEYLIQMYEKRRDWEKLISLRRGQAEQLSSPQARVQALKELANLATEKVRKPEICIDLWAVVVDNDPEDLDALNALSQLYERAREYEKLADVLWKLSEATADTAKKIELLNKLGQIAGDRLKDEERAVEAYRMLLTLQPDDRRAQEQLKKRYVTLGRWDDLEVFYAESGKWDEFIRVLESNESRAENDQQRIGMLMKIAELWMTQKGKPDRAARAYEKVLSFDANHLDAAERLIPIYGNMNNPKGLASAIEVKLNHVSDPSDRLELLREVASLYETRIKDTAKAFDRYASAFEIAPNDAQCQTDVERVAELTGRWDDLIAAYRAAVKKAEDDGDREAVSALRLRLGRVLVEEVKRVDDALTEYRAVYEAEPENAVALEALEKLYRQTERWKDLLEVYEKRRELAYSPEDRKPILFEIAKLYEVQIGDAAKAIETYRAVLEDDAADAPALAALDTLYQKTGEWEPYAEVLRRRIELDVNEGELIDLKFRLAQAEEKHLARPAVALENYREILFLDADHEGARTALEGMLENVELRGEAASILENIYEVREDWEKLIKALEILVLSSEETPRRVELLRKIASVAAGQLGDRSRAFDAQARAVREDPSLAESRQELEEVAQAADAWDQLIALYNEVADGLSDATLARDYWLRLAGIEERLGRVAEAAQSYTKILGLDPADGEALLAMDALYTRTERWEDLISVYRRRIELAEEGADREALYAHMASVYVEKLGKPDEAIAAYREVLSLDPTSQVALAALESLFTRQRMWAELAENLETRLGLAETEEEQIGLMLRLASLREREMNSPEAAIEGYRQVLERDAANADALAALERLGTAEAHELAISEILEPLYRQQGDYQKLISVYEVQVRRADDANRKVELLHGIAQLYEDAASDPSAAFDTHARALAVDPGNETTQEALDRLARASNRFTDLAKVFEDLAEKQTDPELGSRLYTFAARVVENDVGDVNRAIELYRKVLGIDPTNLAAAESLQTLFQSTERFADMSLILQRKAEMLSDAEEQKAALYQAATLEEEVLERPDDAIAVYKKVLELDSEDLRSVDALIGLYLKAQKWAELLEVYSRKADLVMDAEEKKLIYYEVGAVYERELGNVQSAIDTYQKVLELDPDDLTALGRLDVLYQTAQNWSELLTVLMHEAELTSDPAEAIGYQYRIAELYEKHLGDVARAVELYRDILGVQPDHAPTLAALEGIKSGDKEALGAAAVLEPVYEAMGEWQKLVSVLEVQVKAAQDPFARVDLLHRIAALQEESLGDATKAFETYSRAVGEDSQNEQSLGALERLAMQIERWPAVASLYDTELDKLQNEPERLVELGLRVAQVYEVQLESLDNAVARYRRVLEADPENQSAVRSLDRLFSQAERWTELAEILSREAELGQSPEEILEFKFRLGSVYQLRLNDIDKAIAAYSEVINAAPEHEETLRALEGLFESGQKQLEIGQILEPLYQSAGEWEKLIRVHEAQLAAISEPEERIQMYYRIAEDAEERLMDPVQAFRVYVRALREKPLDEKSGEEIERLAGMIEGGWEELANAYADVMSIEGLEPGTLASIGRKLARVFEEELADVQKAEESYRFVLSVAPKEPEALANLDRIYSATEQYAELAGILEQRAEIASDEREKVELYGRLGQVYEEQLQKVEEAIVAYRKIFDQLEPNNEDAVNALARIYETKESWNDLKVVYGRKLDNAVGDVEEAEIRARLANLASERLGNIDEAIEGWKRVLDLRGEDPEALLALSNLYERQERWAELSDVLERHFDIAESDEDRVNALTRRARLFTERLGRDDEALDTWQRVLDIDFANVAALRSVADIWRRRKDANELVTALHATVDRAGSLLDPEELKAVFRELGKTYGTVLEQSFDAAEAWRKLLEVDPSDFEAMDELEKIYRAEERWPDVVGVKMQRAEALQEPAEKIRELTEVTQIWQKVEDYDQATPAFEKILQIEPTHHEAFIELEKLHRAAGRWEQLVEMYLNRLETLEEVSARSELLRRIATVFEEHLGDNNQAFDALVNAFSEDYGDDATSAYLERMAQATGRWGELINTANAWLQEQEEVRTKIQLCLRLGKWYGEDLGHPEYAQPYYAQVMQLDPNNVKVVRQMANIHRSGANWQKMGETLTRALDIAVANEDRRAILFDLGELLEKQMSQVDQGIAYYKRSLEVDPLYLPALEALERLHAERGQTTELIQILTSKVKALTDSEQIVQTSLRMGELYEKQLRDLDKAGQVYRDVLNIDASNLPALRGLERVSETLQRWSDLVDVLEKQLDVVESERDRVEVLLKLAGIQEEQFLKADVAAQRYEQALEINHAEKRAYVGLERAYRRLKQWLDLINAYERHIGETIEPTEKVELFRNIAQVYADEVGDADQAISAYQNIVDLDETNIEALEQLAKLYEKQGDTQASIDAMIKVADLTSDGTQRVEMYFRIGKTLDEKLGDRVQAQERFEMALDLNPAHLPSLGALRTIAIDEQDWDRAANYLDQEQQNTEQPRARAKLLVELGRVRHDMLSEQELAIQAYELAIQADPDCEEAALPLVEEYAKQERWKDAEPLAEMLVKKSKGRERQEQHMLNRLLGKVHSALGNDEKAIKAYTAAHQLDVTDQETIRGIAEVSYRLKDWASALTNYQKVLTSLGEEEVEQRTDVYYRLGCIKREQAQAKQAINNFEKALALNSEHRPTLEALVELYAKNNDWKQVAAYKRQILDSVFDEEERFKLLIEIGDVWAEKEKAPPKAIEALEEALQYKPQDHVLLHKLLQLYQTAADWQKMVDTVQSIADLEKAPERKARYFYTMAQLYRDKLEDADRAVELFNEALDLNPSLLEGFERINKILTQDKNWKQLERNYRKMLHRIAGKGNTDLEYTLWHQLGLIYRDRIGEIPTAIEAFKMASTIRPEDLTERQILSELYESTEKFDEAIKEQRAILEQDALRVDPYRSLYRLYLHKQTYDEAWCVASAMAFMHKADAEEQRFFDDYRPQGMLAVKGRLTNDHWVRHLFHADENLYVSKIFEMIAAAALQAKIAQLKMQNKLPVLNAKFKQDPASSTVTFAKTFGWAAQVLGIASPELYVRNDVPGSVVAVPAIPPASVAGQTVLSGFTPQELAFLCGKHLAFYRGEHYIRTLFPTQAELTIMLFAGVMIAAPNTPMPADIARQVQTTAQELAKYMEPVQMEGLRTVVKRFIEEGAKANIRRWSQAVELTACRAGLLVSGDLEIAKKILAAEPTVPGDLSAADKMKELLVFSVSEQYTALRKALGVAIATEG
ncbi:MAG TPA: tetratricopeptide repeat protein [Polyangiaceae bacterium]|nr:tetratricopeptide repeat protein [Polyangiaceae bacterium]